MEEIKKKRVDTYERQILLAKLLVAKGLNYIGYLKWIEKMYLEDKMSSIEIQEVLEKEGYKITPRSVQRLIKKFGITRSVPDAFRLAVSKGRVVYHKRELKSNKIRTKLDPKIRFKILTRDGFKCLKCGATSEERQIEVDHIKSIEELGYCDNSESNLQSLCYLCNMGKYRLEDKPKSIRK